MTSYKGYRIERSKNRSRGRDNGLSSRYPYNYVVRDAAGELCHSYSDAPATLAEAKALINARLDAS